MAKHVAGNIAVDLASAPLKANLADQIHAAMQSSSIESAATLSAQVTDKSENPLSRFFGAPTFSIGERKEYAATVGWGNDRKVDPTGGTNCRWAYASFSPINELPGITFDASIYRDTVKVQHEGKDKLRRTFRVSMPKAFAIQKKDHASRMIFDAWKAGLIESFEAWVSTVPASTQTSKTSKAVSGVKVVYDDAE